MCAICIPPHPLPAQRRVAPRFPQCSIKLNRNASESVKYSKEERRKTPNSEFFFITGKSAMLNVLFYPAAWKLLLSALSLGCLYKLHLLLCHGSNVIYVLLDFLYTQSTAMQNKPIS